MIPGVERQIYEVWSLHTLPPLTSPRPLLLRGFLGVALSHPLFLFKKFCYKREMSTYMLDIDKDIALPANAAEALPAMTQSEELEVRARTIKLISDLQGKPLEPTQGDKDAARELAQKMLKDNINVDFSSYRNETLAYLAGMVSMYDQMLVKDLADYKLYVVNKLVEQSANPDPKYALPAIKALGEVDGVDAFKKRAEVTVQHKSVEEVEKSLAQKLEKLERLAQKDRKGDVIDVETVDAEPSED